VEDQTLASLKPKVVRRRKDGRVTWVCRWAYRKPDGSIKWSQKTFKTEEEALAELEKKVQDKDDVGVSGAVSEQDRLALAEAQRILSIYDSNRLVEAALFYRKHHPLDKSIELQVAISTYRLYRKPLPLLQAWEPIFKAKKSFPRFSDNSYEKRISTLLRQLDAWFDKTRPVASIMPEEIEQFLDSMDLAVETYNNKLSDTKKFFDWCVRFKKYCESNPAEDIFNLANEDDFSEPETYTSEELKAVLVTAIKEDPGLIPYLVLAAFAGLRACEIARMRVTDIDFKAKVIRVRKSVAKASASGKAMARVIEGLPDTLWLWLAIAGGESLVISTRNLYKRLKKVFKAAGMEFRANGFRHSFASYSYAFHQSDTLVRKQTGHKIPATFFDHYAAIFGKGDGEAYFAILPPVEQLPAQGSYRPKGSTKIDWPDPEVVKADVEKLGFSATARKYSQEQGVKISDNGVRKFLRRIG
jgi:integrase